MPITIRDLKAGTAPKKNIASLVGGFVIAGGCFVLWVLVVGEIAGAAPGVWAFVSGGVFAAVVGVWIRAADL